VVQAAIKAGQGDITVELADGVYSLTAPLAFTAADSPPGGTGAPAAGAGASSIDAGANGHTIVWQAAAGAHPVISGGQKVTGWAVSDSAKNIWKATVPSTFVTRQLYVAGKIATRARSSSISRTDMKGLPTTNNGASTTGWTFTNSALSYLNTLAQPQRAELNIIGSWTNRYSPIQGVANGSVTMQQPAWDENTWGYDTVQSPYRQGPIYAENDYTLLDQPGEWYQDTTAGALYYIPLSGQTMATVDVEMPHLEYLVAIGGACPSGSTSGGLCVQPSTSDPTQAVAYAPPAGGDPYTQPAHDLVFSGLTFSYTSWLEPNTDGFADQQTGGFLVGPISNYPGGGKTPVFESARPHWRQMPAAVQVSDAYNISFVGDSFVDLGQVGLGIGNDSYGHASGVGYGANGINVIGCAFSQIAGGGIVIGGSQAWSHHPCGDKVCGASDAGARLINQNMTIQDNVIHDIGIDYRDFAGLMFTYTANVVVAHNEVYNLPYSGIASGLGWGTNDAGGNNDYKTRAQGDLYLYQPTYASATTAKNNTITANYIHQAMLQMNDGGCHYNLSANPGTIVSNNYCNASGSGTSGLFIGDYEDEGSAYLTITKNIFASFGEWVFANSNAANNTGHLTWTNNWVSGNPSNSGGPGEVTSGSVTITGSQISGFPADAQAIANAAGLEAAYASLKNQ